MRLTKEEFVYYVNEFEELNNINNACANALDIRGDWVYDKLIMKYYDLLHNMCDFTEDDNDTESLLDWYCFETDFGKDDNAVILEDDDTERVIDTPEKLYELIMISDFVEE